MLLLFVLFWAICHKVIRKLENPDFTTPSPPRDLLPNPEEPRGGLLSEALCPSCFSQRLSSALHLPLPLAE